VCQCVGCPFRFIRKRLESFALFLELSNCGMKTAKLSVGFEELPLRCNIYLTTEEMMTQNPLRL
jgi:hypothetical protein